MPAMTMMALGVVSVVQVFSPYDATADDKPFLSSGFRLLIQTEGRKDYSPKSVDCDAAGTGICIRDTRGAPPSNPIEAADGGSLRVTFKSWGVSYLIAPDGSGTAFAASGKALGPFKWTMVDD